MQDFPGGTNPALRVVAVLGGQPDSQSLGDLCVALLRLSAGRFALVARLPDDSQPAPPSDTEVISYTTASIDPTSYRFAQDETAFGIRVCGVFDSTSTEVGSERLYLFRRRGSHLCLIFQARTEDAVTDKTSTVPPDDQAWLVRFGTELHHGGYDLFLQSKQSHASKRFVWSGSAYIAAGGRD